MRQKKFLFGALACALWVGSIAFAQTKETKEKAAENKPASTQPAGQALDAQKQIMMNNFVTLQNSEVRVSILQQMLNKEVEELRKMQQAFCENYKLDVEKWRSSGYEYDEKAGKFVEKKK